MNETLMYAKYNQAGNITIYKLLDGLSNEEREQDRGSFYGSLSGLMRHILGGTHFFLDMFKPVLGKNAAASKAVSALPQMPEEGSLSDTQWKELGKTLEKFDTAYIEMAQALSDTDLELPVKTDWYGGNPDTVPLLFMLSQLVAHNIHHRGQISQVLDSLHIEHDFSGIDVAFIS